MQNLTALASRLNAWWTRTSAWLLITGVFLCTAGSNSAWASYDVNIPPPASPISHQIYDLHMYILGFCAAIFVVVFAVMFYPRKSSWPTC